MLSYYNTNAHTTTVHTNDETFKYWDENTQYYENEVVLYEGLRYSSLRMTFAETPLLCTNGAWEPYEVTTVSNAYSFEEETSSYYGSAMQEEGFLFFQHDEAVDLVLAQFDFKKIKAFNVNEEMIVSRLLLPQIGDENTKLSWESSSPKYLSHKGKVTRPNNSKDAPVWLKLTVSKGEVVKTKVFEFWIKAENSVLVLNEEESVSEALKAFSFNDFKGFNTNILEISKDLNFESASIHGTSLTWLCMDKKLIGSKGELTPKDLVEDKTIKLYVLISKGNAQQHKRFFIKLKGNKNA